MRFALVVLIVASAGCRQVLGLDEPILVEGRADARDEWREDGLVPDIDAAPAGLTFTAFVSSTADASSFTFTNVAIGSASAGHVVVLVHARSPSGGYFSNATLTMGNTAMTKVVSVNEGTGAAISALFIAPVSGIATSASFQLEFSGGTTDRRAALGVWAISGLSSITPHDTATFDAPDPGTVDLDVPPGGIGFAGVSMSTVPGGTTGAWSSNVASPYGQLVEQSWISAASTEATAADTLVIVHRCTDTATNQGLVAASFR